MQLWTSARRVEQQVEPNVDNSEQGRRESANVTQTSFTHKPQNRLGLAIVPWHRRPPSTNTGAPWPLRNFLMCALQRKILLSLWPLAYAPGRDDY